MGIVNVTPDSFAEPFHRSLPQAVELGRRLHAEGADIIDVGGESTRPGSARVSEADELARVVPVVAALARAHIPVSIDTVRAGVAEAALAAGARLVNDVSGGLADPRILDVVAHHHALYILQHWRTPFTFESTHSDILTEVPEELGERAAAALAAGLPRDHLIVDPGIGFGKTPAESWELIAHPDAIAALGFPVLWGVSRKRVLASAYDHPTEPWQRDSAGVAVTAHLARHRVWAVRTHTVPDHRVAIAAARSAEWAFGRRLPHPPAHSFTDPEGFA
jgi:dihydropteroate synthase